MKTGFPPRSRPLPCLVFALALSSMSSGCGESYGDPVPDLDAARGGVPIITYHYFSDGATPGRALRAIGAVLFNLPLLPPLEEWTVSAGTFERHLEYLSSNGYRTVTVDEVIDHMTGAKPLRGKCVALTFDDGDGSVYRHAYPLLERYGMKGTLFVITSKIGQEWNELSLSTIGELREMQRSGVMSLQSHTHDMHYKIIRGESPHPSFDALAKSGSSGEWTEVLSDLVKSRAMIGHLFGEEPRALAWPFGFGSAKSDAIAREAGFDGICSLWPGTNIPGESPFFIKRYTITARTTLRDFRLMSSGRFTEADERR
jgi:peptidoglycan/xylan/chitin deacetylase (PgdA/CDA1 family)